VDRWQTIDSEGAEHCAFYWKSLGTDYSDTVRVLKLSGSIGCQNGSDLATEVSLYTGPREQRTLRARERTEYEGTGTSFKVLVFCNWKQGGEWVYPRRQITVALEGIATVGGVVNTGSMAQSDPRC
jgi:hypothetical protein